MEMPRAGTNIRGLGQAELTGPRTAPVKPEYAQIYAEYGRFVWRNLSRFGVPREGIEDAVQDVFLVVVRRFHEFEGRSSLRTWIFGIVQKIAAHHRRKARKQDERVSAVSPMLLEAVSQTSAHGPLEQTVRREAASLVQRVLLDLDEEKRAILIMVELEQMSVVEVAEVLGINVNTAYTRLRAARQALREQLLPYLSTGGTQ